MAERVGLARVAESPGPEEASAVLPVGVIPAAVLRGLTKCRMCHRGTSFPPKVFLEAESAR